MNNDYKEVYFDKYCPKCKNFTKFMTDDSCNECLSEPTNLHSHKPVRFEEDDK